MNAIPSLNILQYFLIPGGAILGIVAGILLPRTSIAQRRATLTFWLAFAVNFLFFDLSYLIGGGVWTRIIFAFTMGFLSFALKLLK